MKYRVYLKQPRNKRLRPVVIVAGEEFESGDKMVFQFEQNLKWTHDCYRKTGETGFDVVIEYRDSSNVTKETYVLVPELVK